MHFVSNPQHFGQLRSRDTPLVIYAEIDCTEPDHHRQMPMVQDCSGSHRCLFATLLALAQIAAEDGIILRYDRLGLDIFRALFPVILTDNGVEFQNPDELEHTPTTVGEPRSSTAFHRCPGRNLM